MPESQFHLLGDENAHAMRLEGQMFGKPHHTRANAYSPWQAGMEPKTHRRVVLASRPNGIPRAEHFRIESAPLRELDSGEFLVRNEFLSVEPAMRGWVNA